MGYFWLMAGSSWTTYILTVILMMITYSYLSRKPWLNLPPGPPSVPVLGSIPFLGSADPRKAYRKMRMKYGDIFTVHLGAETFVVANGYTALMDIHLYRGNIFAGRPNAYAIQGLLRKSGK